MKPAFLILYFFICLALANCRKGDSSVEAKMGRAVVITQLDSGLQIPWGLALLPNGDLLYGERYGKFHLLKKDQSASKLLAVRQVNSKGEAGLLGIAVDPLFENNHYVYAYESFDSSRITRFKLENDVLLANKVIFSGIPVSNNHNGGALKFGPDGYLYIGTGDQQIPNQAQDKKSLAGKILRIDREGNIPPGNPFNNAVWSYGHRNVQGFCWTPKGILLATEHGPSVEINGWCCHDEINVIEKGKNYGWPLAVGGTEKDTLTPPTSQSGEYDTWAPSGCTFLGANSIWKNCLLVGTLRGERLMRFYFFEDERTVSAKSDTLTNEFHRIRNVIECPDGSIIFNTSNYGSSFMAPGYDKVLKISIK